MLAAVRAVVVAFDSQDYKAQIATSSPFVRTRAASPKG
jgi:hypothetical protein